MDNNTTTSARGQRWSRVRFVTLAEVVGYLLVAGVAVLVGVTLFLRAEIKESGAGPIRPMLTEVTVPGDALPVERLVPRGQQIDAGVPVISVLTGAAALPRALARRHLEAAIAALSTIPAPLAPLGTQSPSPSQPPDAPPGTPSSSPAQAPAPGAPPGTPGSSPAQAPGALDDIRRALDALPPDPAPTAIPAPRAGCIDYDGEPEPWRVLPAGAVCARLYDLDRLEMTFTLTLANASHDIAVGNTVRAILPDPSETLVGAVIEVTPVDNTQRRVTARFESVTPSVRDRFKALVFADTPQPFPDAKAEVVVGTRSLFREIFGRR